MRSSKDHPFDHEYIYRINKVLDYIDAHLGEDLSLDVLSQVANFSNYHFHRLFSAIMGEPLSKYIQRIRLEKAALILMSNAKHPIGQIASLCGFENQSSFSRAFQVHFGFSASELRKNKSLLNSKNCKTDSKGCKDALNPLAYNEGVDNRIRQTVMPHVRPLSTEVKSMGVMPVAYIRVIGTFNGDVEVFQNALQRLVRWAEIRDLLQFPETKILSLYHDNPDITDDMKVRTSLCITVPEYTRSEGEIGKMVIPGGRYAVHHFVIGADAFKSAWDFVWGQWLPGSGYQPDERPCFEVYLNNPSEHPEHRSMVDIYVPVKPM